MGWNSSSDLSPAGIRRSAGLTVNYVYELNELERNTKRPGTAMRFAPVAKWLGLRVRPCRCCRILRWLPDRRFWRRLGDQQWDCAA